MQVQEEFVMSGVYEPNAKFDPNHVCRYIGTSQSPGQIEQSLIEAANEVYCREPTGKLSVKSGGSVAMMYQFTYKYLCGLDMFGTDLSLPTADLKLLFSFLTCKHGKVAETNGAVILLNINV